MTYDYQNLLNQAQKAANSSYVPYSQVKFGVSLLCNDNSIFCGSCVEIANYGSSIDPVGVAVGQAILNGNTNFLAMAIYPELILSGSSRQILVEFNPNLEIIYYDYNHNVKNTKLINLLPNFFGPKDLKIDKTST